MLVPPVPTAAATLATAVTLARPPLPAPPVTTAFASRMLELRQTAYTSDNLSYDLACIDYIDALSCDSAYISCLTSIDSDYYANTDTGLAAYSSMASGISACYCNYGVQYLSCYYGALENKACISYFGTYDWTSYESYWYLDNCGTVPPTLFAGGGEATTTKETKPPSIVSLDLQSVQVVTISTPPPIPTYTYTPLFQSTGSLLQDECASTQFTLLEDVSTVYWAAYIGCASNQPQCCPWTAASEFFPATVTGNTTVTVTSTLTAGATAATGSNVALNAFPAPANQDQGVLKHCASDYYSISGQCCPSNYWPFTRDLGGQTPCYSSLPMVTEAPTLTEGLIGQPTDTQKPTSAVINVVWAMSYPVASKGGLSKGAVAGVSVAAVVVVAALAALSFFLFRARRKNKALQQQQQPQQQPQQPGVAVPPPQVQYVQPQQEGLSVASVATVPVAYDPNVPQGMVQVQPAGGYVYLPTQQQPYPPQGYVDNRASLAPSSLTPVSTLAPQTTGTTNASELSTTGLVSGVLVSPGPAPIAEADESAVAAAAAAAAYQHQLYQQQMQQQYYQQQFYPQGQQPPAPGYVSAQPVYGQPQPQHAELHEAADGQPAPVAPVEMASPGAADTPLPAGATHPPVQAQGHPPQ